jgi:hypothetical protein
LTYNRKKAIIRYYLWGSGRQAQPPLTHAIPRRGIKHIHK